MNGTTTGTATTVDEQARVRVFTALGLALTALMGGGVFATSFQWMAMKTLGEDGNQQYYFMGIAVGPLAMGAVGLWLASTAVTSHDALARPLAKATLVFSGLAVLGAAVLMVATYDGL